MDREVHLYPSFRALRRALVVSDMHHLTRAAQELGRSQSAVTRSIADLEQFLGVQLFERTTTGMAITREGDVLFRRVRAAVNHMARAELDVPRKGSASRSAHRRSPYFLDFNMGNAYAFIFLAVCDHRDIRKAALAMGISPTTVRKSIGELERQVDLQLFQRAPRGTVCPTESGRTLAGYAKRALWEIRAGLDELKSLNGRIAGHVRIGVMSTARSVIVPRAVDRLRRLHPEVVVDVHWANYDDLKVALSCGDIDFIVGSLRSEDIVPGDRETDILMKDRVEVVARAGHPLRSASDVSLGELLSLDWILPPPYFPLRIWFRALLESHGLREPQPFIQTASLALVRGTLLESDCVALSTRLQCWHDLVEHGLLSVLPVTAFCRARAESPFCLHLTRRGNAVLSPAAQALWTIVTDVASTLNARLETEWTERSQVQETIAESHPFCRRGSRKTELDALLGLGAASCETERTPRRT